jgi:amino acid efflux transporter
MTNSPRRPGAGLTTPQGAALYIGALLGPSVLLLPGLAATLAGPASVLAWLGLLVVSGALAAVFTALGARLPGGAGVAGYVTAGLGPAAGRAVAWCFLAGVVCGAPVVCLIGGGYLAALCGGGRTATVVAAGALLATVLTLTAAGARAGTSVQLGLVGVLILLVVVAVLGSAPAARAEHWAPFAPHGAAAVGRAASVLMLSFVGWEAIAPLTGRLADPARQLPRVIGIAFVVTSAVYLGLASATVAVLGADAGGPVPLAGLLRVVLGPAGTVVAAVAAVALTLAATNAYLTGAAALAGELFPGRTGGTGGRPSAPVRLRRAVAVLGALLLGGAGTGLVDTAALVGLPTTLFIAVYLGATLAAARLLSGRVRALAALSAVAVAAVAAFCGWMLLVAALVAGLGALARPARAGVEGDVGGGVGAGVGGGVPGSAGTSRRAAERAVG